MDIKKTNTKTPNKYYYIVFEGVNFIAIEDDFIGGVDYSRHDIGNYFTSKKEAIAAARKMGDILTSNYENNLKGEIRMINNINTTNSTENDFTRDVASLRKCNANFFTRADKDGIAVVNYDPYLIYNKETQAYEPSCYVYHWCDTYDPNGNFIKHEVYECTYTTELDYDI